MSCIQRTAVKNSKGGRKIPMMGLLNASSQNIFNVYVPGSGVGATSISVRRLKKRFATPKIQSAVAEVVKQYILTFFGKPESQTLILDINSDTSIIQNTLNQINSGITSLVVYSTSNTDIDELIAQTNVNSFISNSNLITSSVTEKRNIRFRNGTVYTLVYQFQNNI